MPAMMTNGGPTAGMRSLGNSARMVQNLQQRYGTFDAGRYQSVRQPFWSFVPYPVAGVSALVLFASNAPNVTLEDTNLPRQNDFGLKQLQLKAIRCTYKMAGNTVNVFNGTDASTFYTEFVNGIFQAGILEIKVGERDKVQLPLPWLYAPPADGRIQLKSAGLEGLTLNEATPNTVATYTTAPPHAQLTTRKENAYLLDPNIVIESGQTFKVQISFPAGPVPITATGVVDDEDNPLKVGVIFDGIVWQNLQ